MATLTSDPRQTRGNDWSHFGEFLLGGCSLNLLYDGAGTKVYPEWVLNGSSRILNGTSAL